jgi:NTE family protein
VLFVLTLIFYNSRMNRRTLIKASLIGTTLVGATAGGLLLSSCTDTIREYTGADAPRFEPALAQPRSKPAFALVLGGGGPRGFAHAGVLKVLDEAGLVPELVVGASVGALIGCLYADGMTGKDIEKMALDLNVTRFVRAGIDGISGSGDAIEDIVTQYIQGKRIEELKRRFALTVTRSTNMSQQIFNAGHLGVGVRASCAIPDRFKPVRINGELFVDGDEAQPVPIKAAKQLGADIVIAVDVSAHLSSTPAQAPEEWRVRDRKRTEMVQSERGLADIVIHPDLGYYASVSDAYRRRSIALAEELTRAQVPKIKALLDAKA